MFSLDFLNNLGKYAALIVAGTEAIKRTFKLKNWLVVIASFIIAFVVCLPELANNALGYFLIAPLSAIAANWFWKAIQSPTQTPKA